MAGLAIIGAGPGIGQSVALRFAREGMPVALVARKQETLQALAAALSPSAVDVLTLTADSSDERAIRAALDAATAKFGLPEIVVYNAAVVRRDLPGELSAQGQLDAWAVNVVGALTAATHIAPSMMKRGSGSFIITGGMPEPDPRRVSLSLGKAGVRALATMLDKTFGPAGIHVATVTVGGAVAPGTALDPDVIAEHYWQLHAQPRAEWELEVTINDRSSNRADVDRQPRFGSGTPAPEDLQTVLTHRN